LAAATATERWDTLRPARWLKLLDVRWRLGGDPGNGDNGFGNEDVVDAAPDFCVERIVSIKDADLIEEGDEDNIVAAPNGESRSVRGLPATVSKFSTLLGIGISFGALDAVVHDVSLNMDWCNEESDEERVEVEASNVVQ
jgi:hypothetical protein